MSTFATPIAGDDPTPTVEPRPLTDLDIPVVPPASTTLGGPGPSPVPKKAGEAIRHLLNRYEMSSGKALPPVIAVTSAIRGEGVTTLSRAVASILSTDLDVDVCWMDLSCSAPSGKKQVTLSEPGISEVLRGSKGLDGVLAADPTQPRVRLVPLGDRTPGDQSRLVRSPQLADVITEALQSHSHVVIDAGAVLESTEAPIAIRQADAYLLVVRHGATTTRQVQTVTEELTNIPSLGAILNQYRTRTPSWVRNRIDP